MSFFIFFMILFILSIKIKYVNIIKRNTTRRRENG
nr:MAG TPA: hypothetical protein [Caudoviricetes sp.]